MPKLASHTAADSLQPSAILVVSQRPRPGLGRILPSLEALGLPAAAMLAGQIGDSLPPPFHIAPHQVAVLAIDAESVRAAWHAGAGLVAGLGSGRHGASQLAAGAELLIEAPSQIGSGSLLSAYADKFRRLPQAGPMLAGLAGRQLALLFDFDGTLAPVPDHPADGRLPPPMRELLDRLVTRHPLAVVSGRALHDLAARVALPSAYLAGNHGLELRGADYDPQALELAADWRPLLDAVHDRLSPLLAGHPGCVIEHKGVTVAVHYRALAPGAAVALRRGVVSAVAAFDGLVVDGGRQVLEIRPAIDRDKGSAVDWLHGRMQRLVGPCTPIFFGDDLADEAAFRAARRAGGYGVLIARNGRPTAATCRLDSPEALQAALASLLA
jgi:trehalose-phosphatase